MTAMLNKHKWGEVYIGIENDGSAVGLMMAGSTMRDISQAIAGNLKPKIHPIIEAVYIDIRNCIRVAAEGENASKRKKGKHPPGNPPLLEMHGDIDESALYFFALNFLGESAYCELEPCSQYRRMVQRAIPRKTRNKNAKKYSIVHAMGK